MKRRGFTVVELLIVVFVIAILATLVIVAYRGIQQKAYVSRADAEASTISKAAQQFYIFEKRWPADVDRNVPAELTPYMNGSSTNWPNGPWPSSVYDYDYFTGSDGNPVVQISIRFCPVGGPLTACKFPGDTWATGFQVDSSAYWCITGICKSHPSQPDNYPGYCINCKTP